MTKKDETLKETVNIEEEPVNELDELDIEDTSSNDLAELLKKTEEERDDYLLLAQRVQAEFDNFRRRNNTSIANAYVDSKLETIEKILPILDNIDRALESSKDIENEETKAFYEGVKLVSKQFVDVLNKMGVEEIEALDEPFNPEYHDAVMQAEADEGTPKDTVVEVLLKGYKAEDKVVRYSMVKVAK